MERARFGLHEPLVEASASQEGQSLKSVSLKNKSVIIADGSILSSKIASSDDAGSEDEKLALEAFSPLD